MLFFCERNLDLIQIMRTKFKHYKDKIIKFLKMSLFRKSNNSFKKYFIIIKFTSCLYVFLNKKFQLFKIEIL